MAGNRWRWLDWQEMTGNSFKLLKCWEMAVNGLDWLEWLEVDKFWKQLKMARMAGNDWRQLRMVGMDGNR